MALKAYEFWHPRLFEAPYYVYLLSQCLLYGLSPKELAKANYALDHGELGLGSKYSTQMAFDQQFFLPTILLIASDTKFERCKQAEQFAAAHGFPLILKPDIGAVGKAVEKVQDLATLHSKIAKLDNNFLLQKFTANNFEFGVFVVRLHDALQVTGINQKHFPTVVGNGVDNIATLASQHYRYSHHWALFLKYLDTTRVPQKDEVVQLSFVGSHTMGCKFTDDSDLCTPAIIESMQQICTSQAGFNFGRFDVKAESIEAFQKGEFVVIEVNGIASLPTHMFDPTKPITEAYRTFFRHGKYLAKVAHEHRKQPMHLDSYQQIWQRAKENHATLNQLHESSLH